MSKIRVSVTAEIPEEYAKVASLGNIQVMVNVAHPINPENLWIDATVLSLKEIEE